MTANGTDPLQEVTLPDGSKAYKMSERQAKVLSEMLADRIWWDNTMTRIKRAWPWMAGFFGIFVTIAMNWPVITRIVRAVFREIPE